MRDIKRIDIFCTRFSNLWSTFFPDLRFGQMMINFFNWHITTYGNDPFYIEEDEFLNRFRKWCNESASNFE